MYFKYILVYLLFKYDLNIWIKIIEHIQFKGLRSVWFFFYTLLILFSKDTLHWSNVTFIMLQKISISNQYYSFKLLIRPRIQK